MVLAFSLLSCVSLGAAGSARPFAIDAKCDDDALRHIPPRSGRALTGHAFAREAQRLSGRARDALVVAELRAGNVPSFLRRLVPVTVDGESADRETIRVTVCVLPDYLAVGSDDDFLYVPMGLKAALDIAARYGFVLPTPKLVDAIYAASPVKLDPQPLTPGDQMRSTAYVLYHSELIALQRALHPEPLGTLTSGDKKDIVLTARLWRLPGRVAIYGWHRAAGLPIQPLSTVHGARYADYSHGVRLVGPTVYLDDVPRRIEDVLADRKLAPLLSDDGALSHLAERLAVLAARLED
jgi:hypothetical protein